MIFASKMGRVGAGRHRTGRRSWCAPFVLLLPLVSSSCFTMALWGFLPEDERNPVTGEEETSFVYDKETPWSWTLLGWRVLATPFALGLDCLTCPVQVVMWGWDDEEERNATSRHR